MLLTYEKKTIAAIIHDENRDRFHEAVHKPNEMEVSVGVKIKILATPNFPKVSNFREVGFLLKQNMIWW